MGFTNTGAVTASDRLPDRAPTGGGDHTAARRTAIAFSAGTPRSSSRR
jgi:hypothetical protein